MESQGVWVWQGPLYSLSLRHFFPLFEFQGYKSQNSRIAMKDQLVHKWKKKKAKWMLKPFFLKQNRNRAFDPLSPNNKTLAWTTCVQAILSPSVCTRVSTHPHTDMHGLIHTHSLFSKSCIPPASPRISFFSFLSFLSSSSLSLFFCFFDISKLAVQEMAETATSLFFLKKSMLILLLAVITYPRTHSEKKKNKKQKKPTLRCQSKKKKKGLGRRGMPFIHFQIVIVFSLFLLIIFFFSC